MYWLILIIEELYMQMSPMFDELLFLMAITSQIIFMFKVHYIVMVEACMVLKYSS